ncbi:hypothetical protein D3C71_1250140 [compost metagenome]
MQTHYTKRSIELIAVGPDGTTYVIERRCTSLPCEDGEPAFFFCCLQDGSAVSWLGENHYQLSDGTALLAVACRLVETNAAA